MSLEFVDPPDAPAHWRVVLYGPAGTGKSVAAAGAPGPILYLNAEGPGALFYARKVHGNEKIQEVEFEDASTLDEVYLHLRDEKHPFRTVVVDTVGEVHKGLLAEYGGARPSLQQHGDVNIKVERFIRGLRDLPLNTVLLAHEQLDDVEGEAVRRPQTGGRRLPETLMAMVDIVAYTGMIPATEDAPTRYVGQLVPTLGRRAKDRSGALAGSEGFRDLDLTEWFAVASEALTPTKTSNGRKVAV